MYGETPSLSGVNLEDITPVTPENSNSGMVENEDPNALFGNLLTVDKNGDTKLTVNGGPNGDGKYAITATGGKIGNYNVTFEPGTYTVTQRPVTVVIQDAGSKYGQAVSHLGHDVKTGIGTYDIVSGDDLTITLSTTATAGSGVGAYAITGDASGADLGNYAVTFQGYTPWKGSSTDATPSDDSRGTYTVSKADLGLAFDSDTLFVPYGDSRANGMTLVNASADGKELTGTELSALTFTYTSSNKGVVSVDENGQVTAHQENKDVTITVTVNGGSNFNNVEGTYTVRTYPAGGGASCPRMAVK